MKRGSVSNNASFSKKNDDLRYISDLVSLRATRARLQRGQVIFVREKKKTQQKTLKCALKFIARKNALYVRGGNRMTARRKSASSVFWWNGAFAYQIVRQMQHFESEITKAKRL